MTVEEMKIFLDNKPGGMVIFIAVGEGAYIPIDKKTSKVYTMYDEENRPHRIIVLHHQPSMLPVVPEINQN